MRQFAFTILVVLFSFTWVSAQQNDTATQTNNPAAVPNANSSTPNNDAPNGASGAGAPSSNADQKTLEGCLREASGAYLLKSNSGTTYRLTGNTDGLAQYVGKEVRVQGSRGSASDVSTGTGSSSGATSGAAISNPTAGTEPTVQVSSANVISDTCRK